MATARIVVVEDERIVAMDIERGLRQAGYEVVGAAVTGQEAIDLAERLRPDLVLMDIRLQGEMDGIEAAREIRHRMEIPVLFLTAHADAATVEKAKSADPFGYLLKPFEDQELHSAVEIALHKRQRELATLEEAGEALRQSEERFRLLVDSLKDYAVFLLDVKGRVISWNPGAERNTGFTESEVFGQPLSMFFPPDLVVENKPEKLLWEAASEGRSQDEGWRVRKDGKRFWADSVITALRAKDGRLLGFAVVSRDMTERKRAEDEIRQLNSTLEQRVRERTAQLDEANGELNAFTYSVAHDLRAPLRGMNGFLSILREQVGRTLSQEATCCLEQTTRCAMRMNLLIDDLLRLSRVGSQTMEYTGVSPDKMVREIIEELEPETRGRVIHWHLDPLPMIQGDLGLMKQVFLNLLSNAVKYTAGRNPASVHVGYTDMNGRDTFFVKDNGVGFDMTYSNKLFKPFSRLHGEREFSGTGVGLAIVDRIIRRHGGRIWAESAPGQGSTFWFTLGSRCLCLASTQASFSEVT